ncbi:MAG: hypothetical protein K9M49_05130 [Candidatus Marinimicrobia bacterium]|nr:hypothetical protein [Candidatus Neomarinimicrobiota bacterium]MCF7850333.1 hypothetical protein [Candidatus Neomarinimicrobiota bacterium]MCF7904519.1 hypothetical protein [Candidatus Neomarinimicrobiota bacterium]
MKQLILTLLAISSLFGQFQKPTIHALGIADTVYTGLIGSSISDVEGIGDTIWLGSGHGLGASFDNGATHVGYSRQFSELGKGGVSALAVHGDTIWVAMGFDTTTVFGDFKAGGGISRSTDAGASWTYLGQPMDSLQMTVVGTDTSYEKYSSIDLWGVTILAVDVVTPIQNITYDLAFDGTRLWATSFGGGLRVSEDLGNTWKRVMLPWDDMPLLDSSTVYALEEDILANPEFFAQDGLIHLNHVAFSVQAWNDTIWAGTSGGINRSIDGGKSWEHYTWQNSNISGNWVIAMDRQILTNGEERIWASTVTTGAGDKTGVSFFDSETDYWRAPFLGYKAWNIDSDANSIYVATDQALWKSKDGLHFIPLPPFQSPDRSENIYSNNVYAVLVNSDAAVWVGTGDGLAISRDGGLTWEIEKARPQDEEDKFYAYPNPFTPRLDKVLFGQGNLIIRFTADQGEAVSITLYDFAMHQVKALVVDEAARFDGSQEWTWNGRNDSGYLVANGTYFIRYEIGSKIHWTKVMVIN